MNMKPIVCFCKSFSMIHIVSIMVVLVFFSYYCVSKFQFYPNLPHWQSPKAESFDTPEEENQPYCNLPSDIEDDEKWYSSPSYFPSNPSFSYWVNTTTLNVNCNSTLTIQEYNKFLTETSKITKYNLSPYLFKMNEGNRVRFKCCVKDSCSINNHYSWSSISHFWNREDIIRNANQKRGNKGLNVSVYVLMLDGLSRTVWERGLKKTREFLLHSSKSETFEFSRFHSIGINSPNNWNAFAWGELCPTHKNTEFISALYSDNGYVTAHSHSSYSPYNLTSPTPLERKGMDTVCFMHYCPSNFIERNRTKYFDLFPFKYYGEKWSTIANPSEHSVWEGDRFASDLLVSFENQYKDSLRFYLAIFSQTHTEIYADQIRIDEEIANVLEVIDIGNSIVILWGDHGIHYGPHLLTKQGKYDNKFPPLSITIPNKILHAYPSIKKNLKENKNVLITPFDLHNTLQYFLTHPNSSGKSLLESIQKNRTCSEANIPLNFCGCKKTNFL